MLNPLHPTDLFLYPLETIRKPLVFRGPKRLISNFVTSQTRTKITAIDILPNIKRSKSNHTMKFDQLIKHNKRNIFLEKHGQNLVRKLVPDTFLKLQY